MMKRTLTLILALTFAFSFLLTGCAQIENLFKSVEAYSLVKEAVEKTNALDSVELKLTQKLKLKAEGMSLNVPVVMEIKADGLKGDAPVGTVKMTTKSVFGKSEQSFCFDKDYVYLSREDARYRISREDEAASEFSSAMEFDDLLKELPEDVLKDVAVEKNEDGSHSVSVDISKEVFNKMFEELSKSMGNSSLGSLIGGDEDGDLSAAAPEISNPHVDITVREDGYVGSYGLSFQMSMDLGTGDGGKDEDSAMNFDVDITAEFIDPGKEVTVTLPDDLDDYPDYDEYMSELIGGDDWDDWDDDDNDGDDWPDWDDDDGDDDDGDDDDDDWSDWDDGDDDDGDDADENELPIQP